MKKKLLIRLSMIALEFVLSVVFSASKFSYDISPFYFGVLLASIYLGEPFWVAVPIFISAILITRFSLANIVMSLGASAGLGLVYFIYKLLRKKPQGLQLVLSTFLGQFVTLLVLKKSGYLSFFLSLTLGAIFAYTCIKCCNAFELRKLFRGIREKIYVSIVVFGFGSGLYSLMWAGISPYYFALALALPVLVCSLGDYGVTLVMTAVLGAVFVSLNYYLLFPAVIAVLFVCALKENWVFVSISLLVSEAMAYLLGVGFDSLYNFVLLSAGSGVALCLPSNIKEKINHVTISARSFAIKSLVNKNRLDLSGRLGSVSEALRSVANSLAFISQYREDVKSEKKICDAITEKFCANCPCYKTCAAEGGSTPSSLFANMVNKAVEKGEATIIDVPSYLGGNCKKVKLILDETNSCVHEFNKEKEAVNAMNSVRGAMAEQAEGIAGIIDNLKKETRRTISFDKDRETRVKEALEIYGITCADAIVTQDSEYFNISATIRAKDAESVRATKAISRAIGVPVYKQNITNQGGGMVTVNFVNAPDYDALVGVACAIKSGSEESGDTKSITRLGGDKIMVALCDGMGSGKDAESGSSAAISLVENFYKTGVDESIVLPLINKLLTARNDGSFQTLDMCVINLRTAEADFIKLAAPESVIWHKEGFEVVNGGALPLGILEEIRPSVSRRKLVTGDMIVLATDGISDSIGANGIIRVMDSLHSHNPQTVADGILADASFVSDTDDRTVIALRLFRRFGGE